MNDGSLIPALQPPAPQGSASPDTSVVPGALGRAAHSSADVMPMDEAAKQEFLWHTHQYLNEYARFGDTKAAFAGAIASALLGTLFGAKTHIPMLQLPLMQWDAPTWLAAISGLFLIASIATAVWTVRPRLRTSQSKGFIFWGSIGAYGTADLLKTSFHAQSAQTLNDHLLQHVFDISTKVCTPKYRAVSISIAALVIGALSGATALVMQDRFPAVSPTTAIAPPCKNGAATCQPWERDWSKAAPKPGSVVTNGGAVTQR